MYGPSGGIGFLRPRPLAAVMRRANPHIPVIAWTADSAPHSMLGYHVFVLSTSSAHRLDLAAVAADGRYVHLIAVDRHAPRFRVAPLVHAGSRA
jgi:hypothetical protein